MSHRLRPLLILAALLALNSCTMRSQWKEASPETVREQDLDGLPYHPLAYHLDLSILAYQLYAQSLAWPFDPYFEELNNWDWDRAKSIKKAQDWAAAEGKKQVRRKAGLDGYRGPGVLAGFENNPYHDPIVFRYDRIHPWSSTITNAAGHWTEQATARTVTGPIRDLYVCYRITGREEGEVTLKRLTPRRRDSAAGARDVLLAFEGGTGDKGEPGQPASQSLMGFVLLRHRDTGNRYDVHIAFRGSRSGSATRAAIQANWTKSARGNPDWITDLGYTYLGPDEGGRHISTTGKVARGFSRSMDSILPQAMHCLQKAAELKGGRPPGRIYVTGHSLGGGLAQHFTSAVLLGDRYGPAGTGPAMPAALRAWPWKDIKLITFGAPRAGDDEWARTLTVDRLESDLFSTPVDPYDRRALPVAHPSIVPRLTDPDRPAAYRVVHTKDLISTSKLVGGKHVGKSVYLNTPHFVSMLTPWSLNAHEPATARQAMVESLGDSRIPETSWRYLDMTEFNPERNEGQRGSVAEYRKLKTAIHRYYRENNFWFDHAGFDRDFEAFVEILESP